MSIKKDEVFVLVPVFNESSVINEVITKIRRKGFKNILIVDDGSLDQTEKVLKRNKDVIFLRHEINCGKGSAMKTGFEALKQMKVKYAVTLDGDGQHDPKDIRRMLYYLDKGYDIVLGSRFLRFREIPFYKRVFNKVGNIFTYLIHGIYVTDSQSGFRAYSRLALNKIEINSLKYEFDSEVVKEIHEKKLKFKEVPIKVYYSYYSQNKKDKQSLLNGVKTVFRIFFSG